MTAEAGSGARSEVLEVPRTARYHLRGATEAPREVWFLLHGYGQLAGPFLESLSFLQRPGRLLVAPEALSRFYLRRGTGEIGASWMTREQRSQEIGDVQRYLELLWERVRAGRTPALQALGFSQGGASAARWALAGASPVARVTLVGCPLPPDLDLARHAPRARQLAWCFVLGEADTTIDRAAFEQGLARLVALGVQPDVRRFAGGHELDPATLAALA